MAHPNILIPVDGSEDSLFACKVAAGLAGDIPGEETLHLLHCVEPIPNLVGGEDRKKLMREEDERAESIFAPCRELLKSEGTSCRTYVRYGDPGKTIAETASELNCTLIIMGTRGMNDLKSLVLGSVSHDVLHYAEVPVLLAKKKK